MAPTVGALVQLYGRAGLTVHGSWVSAAGEQPDPVAVRLVVQEALTNVLRHAGSVDVDLSVEEADGAWTVRVGNPVREPGAVADHRGGLGLVGLRERVSAVGGMLTYGRSNGRFELTAVVPIPGPAR